MSLFEPCDLYHVPLDQVQKVREDARLVHGKLRRKGCDFLVLSAQKLQYLRLFVSGAQKRIENQAKLTLGKTLAVDVPVSQRGFLVEQTLQTLTRLPGPGP